MKIKTLALATCISVSLASVASAATLTYALQDVVFDDGGTAFGTFDYDIDTSTLSNISVTTTSGSVLAGTSYNFTTGFNSSQFFDLVDQTGPNLNGAGSFPIETSAALENPGETVDILGGAGFFFGESFCADVVCLTTQGPRRQVISGTLVASVAAVPLPAASTLLLSAFGGVAALKRRKKRAA